MGLLPPTLPTGLKFVFLTRGEVDFATKSPVARVGCPFLVLAGNQHLTSIGLWQLVLHNGMPSQTSIILF
jgi:hypothetical protein